MSVLLCLAVAVFPGQWRYMAWICVAVSFAMLWGVFVLYIQPYKSIMYVSWPSWFIIFSSLPSYYIFSVTVSVVRSVLHCDGCSFNFSNTIFNRGCYCYLPENVSSCFCQVIIVSWTWTVARTTHVRGEQTALTSPRRNKWSAACPSIAASVQQELKTMTGYVCVSIIWWNTLANVCVLESLK